ncbi:MAG: hypothetical protein AAB655_01130 [Patescibacteria group bacterium]
MNTTSRYKIYIIFILLVGAGSAFSFVVLGGYYPIMVVKNDVISARRFERDYAAASFYYENVTKIYGDKILGQSLDSSSLQLAVLNKLIEDSLVAKGVKNEVGSDLDYLLGNKLEKYSNDENLKKAAREIYGMNWNDFLDDILIPQASRDILEGRLFARGEKIEDWIAGAKKSARVIILSPRFNWKDEGVRASK